MKKFRPGHLLYCRPFRKAGNRLGLAQWLTDPSHPLTARHRESGVASLFGTGLVKTAEDFGSQGTRPLYPEVLDSLALQLIATNWNMKQLVRSIVLSKTYRQQSTADARTMEDDPGNEWLARGPRIRLSAEMIRDNAGRCGAAQADNRWSSCKSL